MRKVIQIVLAVVIVGLAYLLYDSIAAPVRFDKEVKIRENAVIERIKNIRTAEQAFKGKYQRYTGDFDSLINFILTDSIVYTRTIGSMDDSVAVAEGRVRTEEFNKAVIDTLFIPKLTVQQIRELPNIPYSVTDDNPRGKQYLLAAGMFQTESGVVVPVFEAKAPYKDFLGDMDEQLLINLIDEAKNVYMKYPGIKVGALDAATNDAGNWE